MKGLAARLRKQIEKESISDVDREIVQKIRRALLGGEGAMEAARDIFEMLSMKEDGVSIELAVMKDDATTIFPIPNEAFGGCGELADFCRPL